MTVTCTGPFTPGNQNFTLSATAGTGYCANTAPVDVYVKVNPKPDMSITGDGAKTVRRPQTIIALSTASFRHVYLRFDCLLVQSPCTGSIVPLTVSLCVLTTRLNMAMLAGVCCGMPQGDGQRKVHR